MSETSEIIQVVTKEKLSIVRHYIFEVAVLLLCIVVFFLHQENLTLSAKFEKYLIEDRAAMIKAVMENTRVMRYYKEPIRAEEDAGIDTVK